MLHMHSPRRGRMVQSGAFHLMRRFALLGPLVLLAGCTGFGEFLDHTFTIPGANPNLPMADSENVRRALGRPSDVVPLAPEPGNVWPGQQAPDPTLADVQRNQDQETQRGFSPTVVPGTEPGLPAGRQPRPTARGSSTPPGSVEPGLDAPPRPSVLPPRPRSSLPGPGPQGGVVNTPRGPAVDAGGTSGYRQLTVPGAPGSIMVPNGNGTSTVISPNGSVQTVPTPR